MARHREEQPQSLGQEEKEPIRQQMGRGIIHVASARSKPKSLLAFRLRSRSCLAILCKHNIPINHAFHFAVLAVDYHGGVKENEASDGAKRDTQGAN